MKEEELCILFTDEIPEKLNASFLALVHLSDVDEEEQCTGPIRRGKKKSKKSDPYLNDMKELEFRTNAWKPFK